MVGVVPNSPAAKAGLGTLDMIESVKGIGTRDMPLAYAAMLMQGESGSSVDLSVVRWRRMEPQTIKLFQVCRMRGVPIATFINKMDRLGRPPLVSKGGLG